MHVRNQPVHADFQQHNQSSAYIFPDLWVIVGSKVKKILRKSLACEINSLNLKKKAYLKKGVYVQHESLCSANDELVDTSDGVGSNFGTVVLEKLQEFGYENVQGPI